MAGKLTASILADPSSGTDNITLGATGNVTLGAAASVAGLLTLGTSGIRIINGSNTTNIVAPTTAVTTTLTLPATTGTVALTSDITGPVLKTTQTVSGLTVVDFTGIPSTAKRIMFLLNGVSLSGTDSLIIQLGTSGGIVSTGYISTTSNQSGTVVSSTSGFIISSSANAAETASGIATFVTLGSNVWVGNFNIKRNTSILSYGAGDITLAAALDRIRLTSSSSTSFDAGSVNILYD